MGWVADAKARFKQVEVEASSVTFAVLGEATFAYVRESGLRVRLLGGRYIIVCIFFCF